MKKIISLVDTKLAEDEINFKKKGFENFDGFEMNLYFDFVFLHSAAEFLYCL